MASDVSKMGPAAPELCVILSFPTMRVAYPSDGDGHTPFEFLRFLADPWFVVPWYGVGLLSAVGVLYDTLYVNTEVTKALKAAWPVIVFFFAGVGLALYWWTCSACTGRDFRTAVSTLQPCSPTGTSSDLPSTLQRMSSTRPVRTWSRIRG